VFSALAWLRGVGPGLASLPGMTRIAVFTCVSSVVAIWALTFVVLAST
jgi:hypothetical protein